MFADENADAFAVGSGFGRRHVIHQNEDLTGLRMHRRVSRCAEANRSRREGSDSHKHGLF